MSRLRRLVLSDRFFFVACRLPPQRGKLSEAEFGGKTASGTLFRKVAMVKHSVMGKVRRADVGGMVYHPLNRADLRSRLFKKEGHYEDFLALVGESLDFVPMRARKGYLTRIMKGRP